MEKKERHIWFVIFLVCAIIICVLSVRIGEPEPNNSYNDLEENIKNLQDSINMLLLVITEKDSCIEYWEKRIDDVEKSINENKINYEKTHNVIVNAGVDDNIRILSGFLSQESDIGFGYFDNADN